MKIRLNPRVEELVLKHPRFGSVESLQEYVNANERQLFPSKHAVVLNGERISLGENAKLRAGELAMVLRRTGDEEAEYLAVKIMDSSRLPKSERVHTAWAYPLKEEVSILPPMRKRRHPKPLWSTAHAVEPVEEGYSAEQLMRTYGGRTATFAFAFHPDAHKTLTRLPPHARSEMNRLYQILQRGCSKDRCKLSTGAMVMFFKAKDETVEATPEHLKQFDALIREAGMGYLMPRQEVMLAEQKLKEVA